MRQKRKWRKLILYMKKFVTAIFASSRTFKTVSSDECEINKAGFVSLIGCDILLDCF